MKNKFKGFYLKEETINKLKEIIKEKQYYTQSAYIAKLINEDYEKQKNTN